VAKRFRFRLETVLKLREQREQAHKRIVADRLRQIARAEARAQRLRDQIAAEVQAARQARRAGILEVTAIARHRHWLGRLQRGLLETEADLRTLRAKLAQERTELAEASKQAKIMAKLKERQQQRYAYELARQERLEADEIATMRFVHLSLT